MTMSPSPELCINLNGEQASYSPGDTLHGSITLILSQDRVIGKVTVQLIGRTKSKIVQSNGQSTSTFRGSAVLLDIVKILHNDHYTHKTGIFTWPFEFQIPESVDRSYSGEVLTTRHGDLATAPNSQSHPLPPSFRFAESDSSKGWHAFSSYEIKVTVTEPQTSQLLKQKIRHSTRAVRIVPRPTIAPIDMEDPRQRRGHAETTTIRTLRLLPEHTASLSLMQRTRSFLNPTGLPRFTFDIDVSYPSSLQVFHPRSLPFVVAAIPSTDAESTTIRPSMRTFYRYPSLKIRRFRLTLRATTMCRCQSVLSEVTASASHDTVLADRCFSDMTLAVRSIAWDQKNNVEEDVPTSIDLGRECNVHVSKEFRNAGKKDRSKGARAAGEPSLAQALVTPSFTTYNVSRRYHLVWNIEFECAGEKTEVEGQSLEEVIVLGPAATLSGGLVSDDASWMVAPREDGDSDDEEERVVRIAERDVLPAYSELVAVQVSVEPSSAAVSTWKG